MIIGNPRLGTLGQLPENFDRLSQDRQMKIITDLPPEERRKVLAEYLSKKTPGEVENFWRRLIYAFQEGEAFKRDATRLFLATAGSILYDGFLLYPAERASKTVRSAAYVGSVGVAGLVSFHSYKVLTNPISPDWVKVISAFVGVFSTVGVVGKIFELFSRPGVPAPVFSPMTSVAAAMSGRKRSRA